MSIVTLLPNNGFNIAQKNHTKSTRTSKWNNHWAKEKEAQEQKITEDGFKEFTRKAILQIFLKTSFTQEIAI